MCDELVQEFSLAEIIGERFGLLIKNILQVVAIRTELHGTDLAERKMLDRLLLERFHKQVAVITYGIKDALNFCKGLPEAHPMIIYINEKAGEVEDGFPRNMIISGFQNTIQGAFVPMLNQICYNNHDAADHVAQSSSPTAWNQSVYLFADLFRTKDGTMNKKNPMVDAFLDSADQWKEEFRELRKIMLDSPLSEELKWGVPCYTFNGINVVLMHGFKEYCALLFIKGSLLKDVNNILIRQTENVQAGRQIRFTGVQEIIEIESILKAYIQEAIEIEKAGLKVELKKTVEYNIPEEFQPKLDENPALKNAFYALTPGRQRAYLLYFSQPKQSITREARIDKSIPQILNGKGLND